jgi:hypothetical protein
MFNVQRKYIIKTTVTNTNDEKKTKSTLNGIFSELALVKNLQLEADSNGKGLKGYFKPI